jgi:hypothetical protein
MVASVTIVQPLNFLLNHIWLFCCCSLTSELCYILKVANRYLSVVILHCILEVYTVCIEINTKHLHKNNLSRFISLLFLITIGESKRKQTVPLFHQIFATKGGEKQY